VKSGGNSNFERISREKTGFEGKAEEMGLWHRHKSES
jgi:hypothetical protein